MTQYTCRTNIVNAFLITHISHHLIGHHVVTLDNGEKRTLPFAETFSHTPVVGDYLIRTKTPAIIESICPAGLFEGTYELTPAEQVVPDVAITPPAIGMINSGTDQGIIQGNLSDVAAIVANAAGGASSGVSQGAGTAVNTSGSAAPANNGLALGVAASGETTTDNTAVGAVNSPSSASAPVAGVSTGSAGNGTTAESGAQAGDSGAGQESTGTDSGVDKAGA